MLGTITWPIFAVLFAVGGSLAVVYALLVAFVVVLVALLVFVVVYDLGRGGVQGFEGLSGHPLAFVPHNWVTGVALAAALPSSIWWLRSTLAKWRAQEVRKKAEADLRWRLEQELGRWPSSYDIDEYLYEHPGTLPPFPDQSRRQKAVGLLLAATACASAAVIFWELSGSFLRGTANAPLAAAVFIAVVAAGGAAVYRVSDRWGPSGRRLPLVAPFAVFLVAALFGAFGGFTDRSSGLLRDYCEYGSVSRAELQGCLDHVTDAYIRSLNTDAARFAFGDLTECLSDAGPYCASRLAGMQAADSRDAGD